VTGPLVLVVAAALVDRRGHVLIAQRPEGKAMAGLWEFPGGKVEDGEAPEDALVREVAEELGVTVQAGQLTPFTFASHGYGDFHLLMPLYLCRTWQGTPRALEVADVRFVPPADLPAYPMPAADGPLVERILRGLPG
jgi:8-oxo-dGTP diphosphatase